VCPRRSGIAARWLRLLIVAALLGGCADGRAARQPEGSVAFRAGSGAGAREAPPILPGAVFWRAAVLAPATDPVWESAWVVQDAEHQAVRGATDGMLAGIGILLGVAPAALLFWPAAVGVVAGAAALGAAGALDGGEEARRRIAPPDRAAIAEATRVLHPDRLARDAFAQALGERLGRRLPTVSAETPEGGEGSVLAEARSRGCDGVLTMSLDAIGLAAGADRETFGVFVQMRLRGMDAGDGRVRYERVLSYGPGQAVEGLPVAETYTLEMLAIDGGLVFRHVAAQSLRRMARLLASDPGLPLAARAWRRD
jgi:hypothetical protein